MEIPWQMFSLPCCGMPTRIESLLHCQSRSCGVRVIWNERFPGWADWVEWNSSHKQHLRKLTCAATWFLAQESCLLVWLWAIQYAISSTLIEETQKAQLYHLTILAFGCVWSVPGAWASIEARPSSHSQKTPWEWPLHRCIAVWNLPVLREAVYTKPLPQLRDREGTPCPSFGCESWEGHDICIKASLVQGLGTSKNAVEHGPTLWMLT